MQRYAINVENIVGERRANFVVFCACFGDVNFDDFGKKEQNTSQDAHLGRFGLSINVKIIAVVLTVCPQTKRNGPLREQDIAI